MFTVELFLLEPIDFRSLFITSLCIAPVYKETSYLFASFFFFSPDVFFGPVCEYVISPVGKYAGFWNIPLITAAAQADGFTNKQPNFPLLTRMMGSYR